MDNIQIINTIIKIIGDTSDIIPHYMQKSILKWTAVPRQNVRISPTLKIQGKQLNIWDEGNVTQLRVDTLIQMLRNTKLITIPSTVWNETYLSSLVSIFKAVNNISYVKLFSVDFIGVKLECSEDKFAEYKQLFENEQWKVVSQTSFQKLNLTFSQIIKDCICLNSQKNIGNNDWKHSVYQFIFN